MAPGQTIPMTDRGAVEAAIKLKYGGYAFRLIMKKGHERVCEGKCINEMPPKFPQANGQYAAPNVNVAAQPAGSDAVALRAIDATSEKEARGIQIATQALEATARMLQAAHQPAAVAPAVAASDPMKERILDILLTRALAPAPDPIETFIKLKTLLAPAPGEGGMLAGGNPLVDKVLNAAIEKFMNPPAVSGGERPNVTAELVRALPAFASYVKDSLAEWSAGSQAQARTAAIMRGVAPPQPSAPGPQPNPPAAAPAPQAQPPAPQSLEPPLEWLEIKIVEILSDSSFTVAQAVDETLAFLYRASASLVPRLVAAGEGGLLALFQSRDILRQVPVNARLAEFIKLFISEAKQAEDERKPTPAKVEEIKPIA